MDLDTIKQEMENWVVNYLDQPSKYYNNLRPCPFAKEAWFAQKVKLLLGKKEEVCNQVENWNDDHELTAVIFDEWEGVEEWADGYNHYAAQKDLYLMVFDPTADGPDDPELLPEKWGAINDDVYGWVFIQRLAKLNRYSQILEKQGYYRNLSQDFLEYINTRRSTHG